MRAAGLIGPAVRHASWSFARILGPTISAAGTSSTSAADGGTIATHG